MSLTDFPTVQTNDAFLAIGAGLVLIAILVIALRGIKRWRTARAIELNEPPPLLIPVERRGMPAATLSDAVRTRAAGRSNGGDRRHSGRPRGCRRWRRGLRCRSVRRHWTGNRGDGSEWAWLCRRSYKRRGGVFGVRLDWQDQRRHRQQSRAHDSANGRDAPVRRCNSGGCRPASPRRSRGRRCIHRSRCGRRASSGARSRSQHSQLGLSSSMSFHSGNF